MAWAFRRLVVVTTVASILSACSTGQVTQDSRDDDDQQTANCGNGTCDGGESCADCPADCGVCPTSCGNGNCNGDESCADCPADCGVCPTSCGDGNCNGDESCSTCADDCAECTVCGNNHCEAGETCTLCPADCLKCPELVFWSDWRTATGTSSNAVLDGGKWSAQSYSGGTQVVSASGLGFPASMRNVFRTPDNGFEGGDASLCDGWPLPAVGEAVAFRVYVRHDLENPGGDIGNGSNHNIQPGVGDISFAWSWKWGLRANDDIDNIQLTALNDNVYMQSLGGEYPPGTVMIFEWSFERVTSSTWRARAKLSDVNYRTLGTADTVSAPITNLDVPLQNLPCGSSAPARSLFVGWSGGAGWQNITGYNYFGGVAVAMATPGAWIGPYPAGPEAN